MNPFNKEKQEKKDAGAPGKIPEKRDGENTPKFFKQIVLAVFIFMLISAAYIVITGGISKTKDISLSELAKDVSAGTVKSISVSGDSLAVTMTNGDKVTSKKEIETSLSETLKNYGATGDKIAAVDTTVISESGFMYWLMNLLPIILPVDRKSTRLNSSH